jgi:hypothetical protein
MNDLIIKHNIKTIAINQFFGLGDILFSIPIAKYYTDMGLKVIWPIKNEFIDIKNNFDYIDFVDIDNYKMDYDNTNLNIIDNTLYLPLRYSNNILSDGDSTKCMIDKYKYVNLDINIWKTLNWKRNIKKENELYYDIFNLKDNEDYSLINNTYSHGQIDLDIKENIKTINLEKIKNYNLLDWYKVIENAKIIHTVGTSIVFLIEVIPTLKLTNYVLYARRPYENNCNNYNYLLKKPTIEI